MEKSDRRFLVDTTVGKFARESAYDFRQSMSRNDAENSYQALLLKIDSSQLFVLNIVLHIFFCHMK